METSHKDNGCYRNPTVSTSDAFRPRNDVSLVDAFRSRGDVYPFMLEDPFTGIHNGDIIGQLSCNSQGNLTESNTPKDWIHEEVLAWYQLADIHANGSIHISMDNGNPLHGESRPSDPLSEDSTVPMGRGSTSYGLESPRSKALGENHYSVAYRKVEKKAFLCLYGDCKSQFTRLSDLRRHTTSRHLRKSDIKCRHTNCKRNVRGFSRKDKRDEHERNMHNVQEVSDHSFRG